ncbi:hypothetical protein ACLI4Z_13445 [Natrialbaceae archaeon A-arb3/5]
MVEDLSRRELIRKSGISTIAIGTAGLAGCTASIPGIGGDDDGAALSSWLVEPDVTSVVDEDSLDDQYTNSSIETSDSQEQTFEYVVPDTVIDNDTEIGNYNVLSLSDVRDAANQPATELDWELTQSITWEYDVSYEDDFSGSSETTETATADISAISGSFTPDDVEESLEEWAEGGAFGGGAELSSAGSTEGFDFYEAGSDGFAVSEGYVLMSEVDQHIDPVSVLEAVIDGRREGTDRWTGDDDGSALLGQLSSGDLSTGFVYDDEMAETMLNQDPDEWETGLIGFASTFDIDGETTDISEVFLYESDREADPEALEEHVERNRDVGDRWATLGDFSVSESDRTLTLTGTVRTQTIN